MQFSTNQVNTVTDCNSLPRLRKFCHKLAY